MCQKLLLTCVGFAYLKLLKSNFTKYVTLFEEEHMHYYKLEKSSFFFQFKFTFNYRKF